eukprot:6342625-Prorocentrum_lima.AAC.1
MEVDDDVLSASPREQVLPETGLFTRAKAKAKPAAPIGSEGEAPPAPPQGAPPVASTPRPQ